MVEGAPSIALVGGLDGLLERLVEGVGLDGDAVRVVARVRRPELSRMRIQSGLTRPIALCSSLVRRVFSDGRVGIILLIVAAVGRRSEVGRCIVRVRSGRRGLLVRPCDGG